MRIFKHKRFIKVLVLATLLACGTVLFFGVGTTFARYQTKLDYNIGFYVNPSSHLYVFEKKNTESDDSDNLTIESDHEEYKDFDDSLDWISETDDQSATVIFSNSGIITLGNESILTAGEDIGFKIRLFISEELVEDSYITSFNVTLNVDGIEYKCQNYYLSAHTPMAKDDSYGRGWVYYFVDKKGNEVTFNLKGKTESKIEAVFKVPHIVGTDEEGQQIYIHVDVSPLTLIVDRVAP